ncbi:MAG: hypothetical protein HY651_13325, partial [Acidobacteria bacterium]|nr:hypothetical protein [Acidobacteriota bacterium]
MEHDFETGMDYFYARYYSGAEGRFTGADLPLNDQYPSDPQSWNLYGYVRNSPLIYTDPDGRTCTYRTGPDGRIIADCVDDGPAPGGLTAGEQLCRMLGGCGGSTGGGGRSGPNTPAPASTQPKPDTLKLQNTDTESADSCELPSWLPDWLPPLVLAVDLPILPGLNFANNFALAQGRFYYGPGLAVGSWGVNFGPMVHGNVENAPEVIKGWGWSSNIQLSPGIGYQGIWNSSGAVGGPAVGMPGGSIGYGYNFERYSFCK